MKKVTTKQYNRYMEKKMDEVEGLPFDEQLIKIMEEMSKYKIYQIKDHRKHKKNRKIL